MRYRVAAALAYLGLMVFWIYGVLDHGLGVPEVATWVVLVAAQIAVAVAVGWPALLLPPALVLAAVAAGYSDAPSVGEEFPIWLTVFVLALPALGLMVVAVVGGMVAGIVARRPGRTA
jgi:hypothetical protein